MIRIYLPCRILGSIPHDAFCPTRSKTMIYPAVSPDFNTIHTYPVRRKSGGCCRQSEYCSICLCICISRWIWIWIEVWVWVRFNFKFVFSS
ncbi:hypothetical protein P170DRAFT_130952 [Aspergillus steynii IBT 23096]|uniref:Uncharacterized protein n=1 Tax=Aspergillus steynii IBT 23096 TaxID=1392250 RepID=A0A2I2GKT4_9EURO|nr:uncharacterized protein P170DRAFT_130952 [Aspergillus steynii IBT 23096]PLB53467.1 hypothetical protein P170DRAFT_130952 [Aspergillus steynii IBT 23096]